MSRFTKYFLAILTAAVSFALYFAYKKQCDSLEKALDEEFDECEYTDDHMKERNYQNL